MKYKVKIFRESFLVDFALSYNEENNPSMDHLPEKSHELYENAGGWIFNSLTAVKKYLRKYFREERLSESARWHIMEQIKNLNNDFIIEENKDTYNSLHLEYENYKKEKEGN